MDLKVIVFDIDGTVAETEKDIHRIAFNRAFKEAGIDYYWDEVNYGDYIHIGGGRERLRIVFADYPIDETKITREEFISNLHKIKTKYYMELLEKDDFPARPGIKRLIEEAVEKGIKLAVASSSNDKSVNLLLERLLGKELKENFSLIIAGDMVKTKKPDPEIFNLVVGKLGVEPGECVVVEDSGIGLIAAKAAGMKCVVTVSLYTAKDSFDGADLLLESLGEPDAPAKILANPYNLDFEYVDVSVMEKLTEN